MSKFFIIVLSVIIFTSVFFLSQNDPALKGPLVGIANYGPHSSLHEAIKGLQESLKSDHPDVRFEVLDVNFQPPLIGQMLSKLSSSKPNVIVVMTTPVAQTAKNKILDIPLVFSCITDPKDAGLLDRRQNMTGTSEKQDLGMMIEFVQKLMPKVKTIGMLYATGEANDVALLKMMEDATSKVGLKLMAIPIEQSLDIPLRMRGFKDKVDVIYVGLSGPIQPALPVIISNANDMKIPIINADPEAVYAHHVLGSFGVNHYQIGVNTGKLVEKILAKQLPQDIAPTQPLRQDHRGFISKPQMEKFKISIPEDLTHITVIE